MRPVFLTIEGLACYKERQEIDFSELELFAISGPTGAGKSTVLDAIIFALYGAVPRVKTGDLKEMISATRDRMSVRLDARRYAGGGPPTDSSGCRYARFSAPRRRDSWPRWPCACSRSA